MVLFTLQQIATMFQGYVASAPCYIEIVDGEKRHGWKQTRRFLDTSPNHYGLYGRHAMPWHTCHLKPNTTCHCRNPNTSLPSLTCLLHLSHSLKSIVYHFPSASRPQTLVIQHATFLRQPQQIVFGGFNCLYIVLICFIIHILYDATVPWTNIQSLDRCNTTPGLLVFQSSLYAFVCSFPSATP